MPKNVSVDGLGDFEFPDEATDGQIKVYLRKQAGLTPHGTKPTKPQDAPGFDAAQPGIASDTISGMGKTIAPSMAAEDRKVNRGTLPAVGKGAGAALELAGEGLSLGMDASGMGKPQQRVGQAIDLFAQQGKTPLENLKYAGGKLVGAAKKTYRDMSNPDGTGASTVMAGGPPAIAAKFTGNLLDSVDDGRRPDPTGESFVQKRQRYVDAARRVVDAKSKGLPVDPADRDLYAQAKAGLLPTAEADPMTGLIAEPMPDRPGGMAESAVRAIAKTPAAIAETFTAPENVAIMGGTKGAMGLASRFLPPPAALAAQMAIGAGTTGYFLNDMSKGAGESIGRVAGGDFDQRFIEEEGPNALANAAFVGHMGATSAKPIAQSVEGIRANSLSAKTEALHNQSLQTAVEKVAANRADGKSIFAGLNKNEVAAYTRTQEAIARANEAQGNEVPTEPLARDNSVDDAVQIVKQMYGDRPDLKVSIAETAADLPAGLLPVNDTAGTVKAVFNPNTNEVHVVRDRVTSAAELAQKLAHERDHGTTNIPAHQVAGFAEKATKAELAKLVQEGRLDPAEFERLAKLTGEAFSGEVKRIASDRNHPAQIAADEVMAGMAEQMPAQPGRFAQGMATLASKIPGIQLTEMDARALAAKQAAAKAQPFRPDRPVETLGEAPQLPPVDRRPAPPVEAAPIVEAAAGRSVTVRDPATGANVDGVVVGETNKNVRVRLGDGRTLDVDPTLVMAPAAEPVAPKESFVGREVTVGGKKAKIVADDGSGKFVIQPEGGEPRIWTPNKTNHPSVPQKGERVALPDGTEGVIYSADKTSAAIRFDDGTNKIVPREGLRRVEQTVPPEAPVPQPVEQAAPVQQAEAPLVPSEAPPVDDAAARGRVARALAQPNRDMRRRQLELAMEQPTPEPAPAVDPMELFLQKRTAAVVIPKGEPMPRIAGARFIDVNGKRVVYWPGNPSEKKPFQTNRDLLRQPGGLERALEPKIPAQVTDKQRAQLEAMVDEGASMAEVQAALDRVRSRNPLPEVPPPTAGARYSRTRDDGTVEIEPRLDAATERLRKAREVVAYALNGQPGDPNDMVAAMRARRFGFAEAAGELEAAADAHHAANVAYGIGRGTDAVDRVIDAADRFPRYSRSPDDYKFPRAKVTLNSGDKEWREYAENEIKQFGVPRERHDAVDSRGFSRHDTYTDDKIVALYNDTNLIAAAKVDPTGGVLWLWGEKGAFNPKKSPFWNEGKDTDSQIGRWLALRDEARPYVKLQREMANMGVRRKEGDGYTEPGARGVNETLIPVENAVNIIDGFSDRSGLIAAAAGLERAYVDKGIADLKSGRYDSPEAMDVVQWAHGELRRGYEREVLNPRDVLAGADRGLPSAVPGGDPSAVPGQPAPGGAADAVGGRGAGGDGVVFPEAAQPLYSRSAPSKHDQLVKPIMGDLVEVASQLMADKANKIRTPEDLVRAMAQNVGPTLGRGIEREAKAIYDEATKNPETRDKSMASVKKAMESGLAPAKKLGISSDEATSRVQLAVDRAREDGHVIDVKHDAQTLGEGARLYANIGYEGTVELVLQRAKQAGGVIPGTLSDAETVAVKFAISDDAANKAAASDPTLYLRRLALMNAYRITGTAEGRGLRMRRWDINDPTDVKVKRTFYEIVTSALEKNPDKLTINDAKKQMAKLRTFLEKNVGVPDVESIPIEVLTDKTKMTDLVREWSAINATAGMKARTWYTNSLVSAFKTHAANIGGNASSLAVEYTLHRQLEARLNQLFKVDGVLPSDIAGLATQMIKAQSAAMRDAADYAKTGRNRLEQDVYGDDWVGQLRKQKRSFSANSKNPIEWAGHKLEYVGRALGTEDAYFVSLAGRVEAIAAARMAARRKFGNDSVGTKEYSDFVDREVSDYSSDSWRRGMDRAEYLTFKNETSAALKTMLAIRRKHPWTTFIVTFLTTPFNLISRGAEFAPGVGLVNRGVFKGGGDFAAGDPLYKDSKASLRTRAAAAQIIGLSAAALVAATGASMFSDDGDEPFITGSEPPKSFEKGEREARNRSLQPYTVKNFLNFFDPDERISFRRLDPVATAAGLTVDVVEMFRDYARTGSLDRLAGKAKSATLGQFVDKPFLQGPSDIIKMLQGDVSAKSPIEFTLGILGNFYPKALQQFPMAIDDKVREARNYGATKQQEGQSEVGRMLKTAAYRSTGFPSLPFVGNLVQPRVNLAGEEVGKTGSALYRGLVPADRYGSEGISPEARRMDLNYINSVPYLPEDAPNYPTESSPSLNVNGRNFKMPPEDWGDYEGERGRMFLDLAKRAGLTEKRGTPYSPGDLDTLGAFARAGSSVAKGKLAPRYLSPNK